ncbi:MAG: response regulator [Rhodospirillales bacterium]|nr:response regulator [Rhodospirillales bacterium]
MRQISELRILIVDDEPFVRAIMEKILRTLGVREVSAVADGAAALECVVRLCPDAVFCDIHMQPMDGFKLVEAIRRHADEQVRRTSLIMLTGSDAGTEAVRAVRMGVDGYLLKPASVQRVQDILTTLLRKRDKPDSDTEEPTGTL